MKQSKQRTLASILIVLSLLAACAPAQAVTQEPADAADTIQSQILDTATPLPTETVPPSPAFTQTMPATETPILDTSTPVSGVVSLVTDTPFPNTPSSGPASLVTDTPLPSANTPPSGPATDTPGAGEDTSEEAPTLISSLEELNEFLLVGSDEFENCVITITPKDIELEPRVGEVVRMVRAEPLEPGDQVIINRPVNLRTGPSLSNRIIITLVPDRTPTASSNTSDAAVTPQPKTTYTIIDGPVYTDIGEDDETSQYHVSGRKFRWWKIVSPDPKITGWVAESSACGLFNFIEPAVE